jgi:plasmid stabilization system protein ParE
MSVFALSPLAIADIFSIWPHIAEDSEDAAERAEQATYDACGFVADAPMRGHFPPSTLQAVHFVYGR